MALGKYFKNAFAILGDKAAIPDDSQPSGSVSYEDGFTVDYELDPGVDPAAKDVPRDETNQLYYDITLALKEYQENGTPDYITAAQNGGSNFAYAKWARVRYSDGFLYESRVAANIALPTDATKWRKLTTEADFLSIATTAFDASVVDGEAVYWDVTNSRFDEAVADGTTKQNVIGIADVTNGRVFVYGLAPGFSGLTGNTMYYLSGVTPGALTAVVPTSNIVRVGTAKDADELYLNIGSTALPAATETVAGVAEIATAAETLAGTDDALIVTPLKLRSGFAISLAASGYIKLPDWMSGLIIQWGSKTIATGVASANADVTFPLTFPNAVYRLVASIGIQIVDYDATGTYRADVQSISMGQPSTAGCEGQAFITNNTGDVRLMQYFVVGR
jgi:hypothetical protein